MVTPFYHPVIGGTESAVENISTKLNEVGVTADILTFNLNEKKNGYWRGKEEQINGLHVTKIPALNFLPTRIFRINYLSGRFANFLKQYDIIHYHNDSDLSLPLCSYFVDKPKILHCHCVDTYYYVYKKRALARHIFKNVADIYIVLSKRFVESLLDLGIPESRIRIVPNGINTKIFEPSTGEKIDNLLLFVGRLEPKKGLPLLLKSLEFVKTPVSLMVVGPYEGWPSDYSQGIIRQIQETDRKTIHKVRYLGVLEKKEIIKLYQKASIFVLPSYSEAFPIVNLEALACGTPVVATEVGGVPEVVQNSQNGILVPPNNPTKLAEGIQYLLDNAEVRRRLGINGRQVIEKHFSSDAVLGNLVQIYKEIISC